MILYLTYRFNQYYLYLSIDGDKFENIIYILFFYKIYLLILSIKAIRLMLKY